MVATEFGDHPNIIYEVMNEPGHDISWQQVKDHASSVYSEIRNIDNNNLILVPSPNWAQSILTASQSPLTNVENVAYTMHFYAQSHNFRNEADQALANGIAIWVSEWGMSDFTGDGAIDTSNNGTSDQWVDWMRDRGISWLAWNFANKGESSSALKPYSTDDGLNESMWANNNLLDDNAMQSGPWPDSVIKDSGKWIRSRINEDSLPLCNTDCSSVNLIQAEDYSGMNGVQTEMTSDTNGGENVGYIDPGDWMKYPVNVATAGNYTVSYRIASMSGGSFQIEQAGGGIIYGNIDVPATNDWQNWQTISHTVNLDAGQQEIALASLSGAWNINWFEIIANDNPPPYSDSDSDNDGVIDRLDNCPNTPIDKVVDANGCAVTKPTIQTCEGINSYPNWTANDWPGTPNTHNEAGDMMQVDGNAYSANWYTNSLPGSDDSWVFVKSCN